MSQPAAQHPAAGSSAVPSIRLPMPLRRSQPKEGRQRTKLLAACQPETGLPAAPEEVNAGSCSGMQQSGDLDGYHDRERGRAQLHKQC